MEGSWNEKDPGHEEHLGLPAAPDPDRVQDLVDVQTGVVVAVRRLLGVVGALRHPDLA